MVKTSRADIILSSVGPKMQLFGKVNQRSSPENKKLIQFDQAGVTGAKHVNLGLSMIFYLHVLNFIFAGKWSSQT